MLRSQQVRDTIGGMEVNALEPSRGRNPNGTFAHGNNLQPKNGYQRYADRVGYLQEQYTPGQIRQLASDVNALDELPVRDAMIVRQLAMTIQPIQEATNADVRAEREALLDRLEGKAPAESLTVNVTTQSIPGVDAALLKAMMLRYLKEEEGIVIEG